MNNYNAGNKSLVILTSLLFCLFVSTAFTGCVSAKDWFEKGEALYDSGKYNEAVDAYTKAIDDLKIAARLGFEPAQEYLRKEGIG